MANGEIAHNECIYEDFSYFVQIISKSSAAYLLYVGKGLQFSGLINILISDIIDLIQS